MHGVRIAYHAAALPRDPFGSFFDPFPDIDEAGPVDLTIVVRRRVTDTLPGVDLVPFFFYGKVQAYRSSGGGGRTGVVISNDSAHVTIAPDASVMEVGAEVTAEPEDVARVLHVAILWALRARALFDLHAAAVIAPGADRPILIVGDSGAGKTTLTLAFLEAGYGYLGDDRVLLRAGGPTVLAYPRPFHVGAATLRAFERVGARATSLSHEEKRTLDPGLIYPAAFHRESTRPAMLLLPRIVDEMTTSIRPASQADAFGQLLVSSAIVAVDGMPFRDDNLACLRDLASTVPAFELLAGRDVLSDPVGVVHRLDAAQLPHTRSTPL